MAKVHFESPDEREEIQKKADSFWIAKTGFKFIDDHYGFRPGHFHILIGTQGKGKSTLARSILWNLIRNKVQVLVYSTEETLEQFKLAVARAQIEDSALEYLTFYTDMEALDMAGEGPEQHAMWEVWFRSAIARDQPKVIMFDNITTTTLYENRNPADQTKFLRMLRRIVQETGRAMLIVAHMSKNVNDSDMRVLTGNDVRGSGGLTNGAEQTYIFRRINVTDENGKKIVFANVFRDKTREQNNQSQYLLTYDFFTRSYTRDEAASHQDIEVLLQKQDRVKAKKTP